MLPPPPPKLQGMREEKNTFLNVIDCSSLAQQEKEISQEFSPSFRWGFVKRHSSCISMNDKSLLRSGFYVSEHVIIDYSNLRLEKSLHTLLFFKSPREFRGFYLTSS